MLKLFILPAFILLAIIQWFIPAHMIWKKQQVLDKGLSYKFEAAPVDPEDPFRGRYIVLNFKEINFRQRGSISIKNPEQVYLRFSTNKKGFSVISSVSNDKPEGSDYLKAATTYVTQEKDSTYIYLHYPFSEYYMEESKAPLAEIVYAQRLTDSASRTYALVKIWKGDAVIENVFVNDTSIHEILRRRLK